MNKKHILILGSGISGLSAAWALSQMNSDYRITLLEASNRAGGWIDSSVIDGFFFEKGPRVFKTSKSQALLDLIDEIGMSDQISIAKGSKDRHILWEGKLHKLPQSLAAFLFSDYMRPMILPILTEWTKKPLFIDDESIEQFITRRLGKFVLDRLFDPLTQGIYAADPRDLSIRSCFASLKDWEDVYGSITKGFWHEVIKKRKNTDARLPASSLFTLKGGVATLVDTLVKKVRCQIHYEQTIKSLYCVHDKVVATTQNSQWEADAVFIALPAGQAGKVLQTADLGIAQDLMSIPSVSVTSILLGFPKSVLPYKGFGYLVPSSAGLAILGGVFDSEAFSDQSQVKEETRITLMLKGSGYSKEAIDESVQMALKKHLGIQQVPKLIHVQVSQNAIPKFLIGHKEKIAFVQRRMEKYLPRCFLLGNYLRGVSVSDCIKHSRDQVMQWQLLEDRRS